MLLFYFTTPSDWLEKLAPLSQLMKTKTNRDLVFPALGAGYTYSLCILIGSLDCLPLL